MRSNHNVANEDNSVNNKNRKENEDCRVQDNSLRSYYSQIPHIIYELGWSAYKISTYCTVKRIAGDNGNCTKSYTKLAKMSGMSYRNFKEMINQLCEIDPILKKNPFAKIARLTECGDQDTNLIIINDIWPENMDFFKNEGGGAPYAPPQAPYAPPQAQPAPGVGHTVPQGGAHGAYKEEHLKKNIFKKTTTTPTPSEVAAAVHKTKISDEDKLSAKQLQEWCQKEAYKTRKLKQGRHIEEYERGQDWVISLNVFENLIHQYGILYFQEHLSLLYDSQSDFEKGKNPKAIPISNPTKWLKAACKKNFAESLDIK